MDASAGFVAVETAPPKRLARRATAVVVVAAAADGGVVAVAALPMLRRGVRTTAAGAQRWPGCMGVIQRDEKNGDEFEKKKSPPFFRI